jgi:hypothetical protein
VNPVALMNDHHGVELEPGNRPVGSEQVSRASLVRTLPVGKLVAEAKRRMRSHLEQVAEMQPVPEDIHAKDFALGTEGDLAVFRMLQKEAAAKKLPTFQRGGRRPICDVDHFAEVARVYLGAATAPTRTVAHQFHLSRSAAAKQVARARAMGFLGATTKGKPSGYAIKGANATLTIGLAARSGEVILPKEKP